MRNNTFWQIHVPGNNQTYLHVHVIARYSCPILKNFGFYGQVFIKVTNVKIHGNLSSGSRTVTRGRKDMPMLTGALCDCANAHKMTIACNLVAKSGINFEQIFFKVGQISQKMKTEIPHRDLVKM